MGISTHVLNTAIGRPAEGMSVTLERTDGDAWHHVTGGTTNDDGRVGPLIVDEDLAVGTYRITFGTGGYYTGRNETSFYPEVRIDFRVDDATAHYHVPLLTSPWGFSTYRGS
jgi:5-hydroxyisourate hydrolase